MPHIVTLLILLVVANGAPILAANVFGERAAYPLDGGLRLWDGQRLFGDAKTCRGILFALLITPVISTLLGTGPRFGIFVAALAMTGDLLSSFFKRRLRFETSGQARGLDQIPEALLPCLAGVYFLGIGASEILQVVVMFYALEWGISPLLFRMKIRNRPY